MPLEGVRIVEVASYIAVPSAGLAMSQLGADVIRVEPLGGGPDRSRWPLAPDGSSLYWDGLNRGKRAVALNLGSYGGRRIVEDLVCSGGTNGGILISNSRLPGYGFADLVTRRPDLIHAQLTGRRDGTTSVDYTANAVSGFALVTGPDDFSGPINHVLPAWDLLAGSQLALAVVAAVAARRASGAGAQIELALDDVALAAAGNLGLLAEADLSDQSRVRIGNSVYGDLGRDFRTRDGRLLMLVVLTESHWKRLVRAFSLEARIARLESTLDCDFAAGGNRYRHRKALGDLLQDWFDRHTFREASAVLEDSSLLWGPFRTFRDLARDAEVRRHPMVSYVRQGAGPSQLATASPVRVDGHRRPCGPAPWVGEHDQAVLSDLLGYGPGQIERLQKSGVIGS